MTTNRGDGGATRNAEDVERARAEDAAAARRGSTSERLPPEHPNGIRRVHVGCGPHHHREDWWNTDIRPFKSVDEVMDAGKPWRWPDTLDFVYAEHFLEHLDLEQATNFLVEAGRSLRRGGRIRLSTPALEWVLKSHFLFPDPAAPEHITQTLGTNRAFHGWGHKFLYSQGMLQWMFSNIGFEDVRFFDYGESDTAELRGLEKHGGWRRVHGFPTVWIIEGARGESSIDAPENFRRLLNDEFIRYVRSGH